MEAMVFWAAAAVMLVATLLTISSRSPVYSVIFMILSFAATAVLFVGLDAYLLAAIEVLVYAGAIMVLFLFVIMLIHLRAEEHEGLRLDPLAIVVAGTFLALLSRAVGDPGPAVGKLPNDLVGSPALVAETLFSRYAVPFEAVSLLLLAAILGTVVLARRGRGA